MCFVFGGLEEIRTLDPHNANVVRSQLRYKPMSTDLCIIPLFQGIVKPKKRRAGRLGLSQNSKVPKKDNVIANQSADWCGNPPDFQTFTLENPGLYPYPGDCHTSDIGHWLAMTASFWLF